jgi:ribosome-binding ATPase YchF (GTP1/OBG family)
MALKAGIVGLPNVGKSTLFNALTSAKALAANYPFATKDPNVGVITVPDPRLDKLSELVNPQKVQPTTIEIVDIAGLIKGASQGEGLGNQFLANIREVDAIVHVVRCFDEGNVVHVDGNVDPVRDKETIDTELLLKDIETVEKQVDRFKRQAKSNNKEDLKNLEISQKILAHLEDEKPARAIELDEAGQALLKEMFLLTAKPILYVCNVAELETKEERLEFLNDMGLDEPGVNRVIRATYKLLNLITYFTAGEKEVRAWTIQDGWKAPQAAGVIHTDFEKGFIRAEVIKYNDYVSLGSEQAVKEAGKMAVEGKEYVVTDGDVMHFRFNV